MPAKGKTEFMDKAVKRPGSFTSYCTQVGMVVKSGPKKGQVTNKCVSYALQHGTPLRRRQARLARVFQSQATKTARRRR